MIKLDGTALRVPELSPVVGPEVPPELHYILDQTSFTHRNWLARSSMKATSYLCGRVWEPD